MDSLSADLCTGEKSHCPHTDPIDGEIVCKTCGTVLGQKEEAIDYTSRPEKNVSGLGGKFIDKKDQNKIQPHTRHNLTETIDKVLVDAEKFSKTQSSYISNDKFIPFRTMELFKKSRSILRGKSAKTFVAACMYIACREKLIPTSIAQIASSAHLKKVSVSANFNEIITLLDISLPVDKAKNRVRRIATDAGLSEVISRKAIALLDKIPDNITGPNPIGTAAAALYIVCEGSEKFYVSQKNLAESAGISAQTVRNSIKRLNNYNIRT